MAKVQITIPTGYESQERNAETKRMLAKLMLEKGLQTGPMQSWLQVLGQLGSSAAGYKLQHDADEMSRGTDKQILADYTSQLESFHNDAKILSPTELVAKYQDKPFLQDALKPYQEAMTVKLKEGQEHTNFGGQWRSKAGLGEGEFEPNKPTDSVLRGLDGTFQINPVRTAAALAAQNIPVGGQPPLTAETMRDPLAPNDPGGSISGPVGAPNAAPGGPPPSSGEPLDLSLLSPDERAVMTRELQRRAANRHTPMGSPLTPPLPDGVAAGKPYWMVNGVPYDNPEGK